MTQIDLPPPDHMQRLRDCVVVAQDKFAQLLSSYLTQHDTTIDQYIRYLSFQYHLTKNVQRYFMAIAAHPAMARRRKLRDFLLNFAKEEELHYLVAGNDLAKLGLCPLPAPIDVELWHAYFTSIVAERPFVRLGAAVILENITEGAAKSWVKRALQGAFLNRENTKFLVLHQHETLPHGDQIMAAIEGAGLEPHHFDDLVEGARKGSVLYLRMAEWAIDPHGLAASCDRDSQEFDPSESTRIHDFDMAELQAV